MVSQPLYNYFFKVFDIIPWNNASCVIRLPKPEG